MMNCQTQMPRAARWALTFCRRGGGATGAAATLTLTLVLTLVLGSGCQNRAGMSCQQQSDCTPGLLCNKPPAAGPQGYGLCEPGLKGLGELCISSAECSPGLMCSTDSGQPSEDGWHGSCLTGVMVDAGGADLTMAADLRTPTD